MKRGWVLALLLAGCLLLGGCGEAEFDIETVRETYTQALTMTAEADITTHSGVLADYTVSFTRQDGVSTVTLLAPESLAGISARTYEGRAEIEYEDVAVETLLPSVSGFVPVDALSGVIDDLCGSVPADYCAEELEGISCIALTFETSTAEYAGQKRVWLDNQSLAVLRAEFYLDGQMVISMSVRDFAFAGQTPDAQGQNS